jgi:uncharacterized OB-fold protein
MATPYQERKYRDPSLNPGDAPYFEAAGQGKLMLKKCKDCGKVHHYPRAICPHCFSQNLEWVQAKGTGEIYTYSVTRRGTPTPFAIGYVKLDEGISMLTNFINCDLDTLKCGQKVKVCFVKSENGTALPMFEPA